MIFVKNSKIKRYYRKHHTMLYVLCY